MRLKKLSRDFALEASGVDLAQPLSDGAFREIEEAFFAGQVLVLRGQKLTAREFLEFARRFGPPEPHVVDQFHHPEYADILILSNVVRDGQPAGLADAGTISTPTIRISTCRRGRRCCTRSRCRRSAATRCSRTSTRPMTACRTASRRK